MRLEDAVADEVRRVTEETVGLVLRTTPIDERDKLLTILTPQFGTITARAYRAQVFRDPIFPYCNPFVYGAITLSRRGEYRTLREAAVLANFHELHERIDRLSFAYYACDVAREVCPEGMADEGELPLLLNTLYLACRREELALLKGAFELRTMCISGQTPELSNCVACAAPFDEGNVTAWRLDCLEGGLLCPRCRAEKERVERESARARGETFAPPLSRAPLDLPMLAALRYVAGASAERVFAFTLTEGSRPLFSYFCERYLLDRTEREFKTLAFYHEVAQIGSEQGVPPPEVEL